MADENYPLNPLSHYAKCKVLIEELITNMKNKVDFTATILRFSTAYGLSPRLRFDLTHYQKISKEEIEKIEESVNSIIRNNSSWGLGGGRRGPPRG